MDGNTSDMMGAVDPEYKPIKFDLVSHGNAFDVMDALDPVWERKLNFMFTLGPVKSKWMNERLDHLESLEDQFAFLWELKAAHDCFTPPVVGPGKSEADSERLRTEGNILYKQRDLKGALTHYNSSILHAPHPELCIYSDGNVRCKPQGCETDMKTYKSLGYAYANRSAVFLMLKDYDKCLTDIDLALTYGYPMLLKSKLEERREKCHRAKEKSVQVNTDQTSISNNIKVPPKLAKPNLSVPSFSNAIKIAYSPEKGPHVIAARDIHPGELIAVEKSYCTNIKTQVEALYCPVCLMVCQSPVPCQDCHHVPFCSDTCRAKGLKVHKKECKILLGMRAIGLYKTPLSVLALKFLVRTTYAELKDKLPLLKKEAKELPPEKLGFDESGKFISTDYRSVYHVTTSPSMRFSKIVRCSDLLALYMTKVLQQSMDFFVTREGVPFVPDREDFILIGTALLHHLALCTSSFGISDIKGDLPENSRDALIGDGIFPSLSLMRNSCNPPALYYNFGHVAMVRTIRPISEGQEVTLSQAGVYQTTPFTMRQEILGLRGVTCSCEACMGQWPSMPDIPHKLHIKCVQCSKPVCIIVNMPSCLSCGLNFGQFNSKGKKKPLIKQWWSVHNQVKKEEKEFSKLYVKYEKGQMLTKSEFDFVCNFAKLIEKYVQEPSQIFVRIHNIFLFYFYKEM